MIPAPTTERRAAVRVRAARYEIAAVATIARRIGRGMDTFEPDIWQAVQNLARGYRRDDLATALAKQRATQ